MKLNAACVIALVILNACNNASRGYTLYANIKGLQGTMAYIQINGDTSLKITDSVVINGESFLFRGIVEEPQIITIWIKNKLGINEPLCSSFYLENDNLRLTGNMQVRSAMQLTGAKEDKIRKLIESRSAFPAAYFIIHDKLFQAERKGEVIPEDSLKTWNDELEKIDKLHKSQLMAVIEANPDYFASLHAVLNNLSCFSSNELKKISTRFPDHIRSSRSYKSLENIINKAPATNAGEQFRPFAAPDAQGETIHTGSLTRKYLLIDFWASWCGPCRKQIPALKKLYANANELQLDIISVSIDANHSDWQKALLNEQMSWPNVIKSEKDWARDNYLISSIPAYYLLDSKRKIIARKGSIKEIETILTQLK